MPADSRHPDYTAKIARWTMNEDAFIGEDAVKSQGQTYVTSPSGFADAEYIRYISRGKWFGATARTIAGTTGAVFQKPPAIEATPEVEQHMQNITLSGISSDVFASDLFSQVQLIGRFGVLLDFNASLRRPYWVGYRARDIINWRIETIDGIPTLTMVVVEEIVDEPVDQFEVIRQCRYRVHHINEDGNYQVSVFNESMIAGRRVVQQTEIYIPTRRLRPLDFIPFQFFGATDLTPSITKGPLDDLVNVNYSYYRHSVDFEQGLYLTAMPKYVITGHSLAEGEQVPVGSLSAWTFPNPEARATILEFAGQGLQSHERAMETDKQEMAILGARLLEDMPSTQETLGAVALRHAGESGSLKSIANLVSEGLTKVLRLHHWWHGASENTNDERFNFALNTDFSTTKLQPQELQALMALWQGGAISKQTLFWNLKQGEVIPAENEFEDEESLIEVEAPARLPFGEEPEPELGEDDDEENVEVSAA